MRLLVIDGNSIANRAFFGIKLLTTKDGRYTNAIYGFLNILLSLLKECEPDEVAVAFDLKAPTFRHKMYDGYKATRHGMPEELAQQMPVLKELLADLGYRTVTAEGWEADDILGTLAAACAARQDDCFLATGDRDSLQLVSDTTTVLLAATVMGRSKTVTMDVDAIHEKYGIEPKQLIEVKSLMGDTSDNIPGVKGIGEKTALSLVQTFGSLEGVYANLDDKRIKPKQREHLMEDKPMAELSHTLGTIRTDAPIDTAEGSYAVGEGNKAAAVRLLQELEIHSLIPRFGLDGVAPEAAPEEQAVELPEAELAALPLAPSGHYLVASRPAVMGKQGTRNVMLQPESWYAVQDTTVYPLEDADLLRLLDNADVTLDVFNSAPLYARAMAAGGWGSSIRWDGKLAAYLLNPAASDYTVARLAAEYGVRPAFSAPWPEAGVLEELCAVLREKCDAEGMGKLLDDIEFPLCEVLASMEHIGILVDRNGIEAFGQELQTALGAELRAIYDEVGYEFNVNSPKQLGKALFEDLGLPTRKKTKSGYSTNAETLESLRDYSPVIGHILQYRTYQKLNSTYVEGLLKVVGADGRIHSTFNQTETRTGRISSGEPNLQNIPVRTELGSRFRKYFIAPQGETLLDADYSQIELRLLAHISGDEAMCEAFRSGADIHRSTAARIYGLPPEQVTPALRSSAKAVNFGIVYGIGAFSLSKDIGVSVKEADAFIKNYFANFPGVKKYLDETVEQGRENGYVTTLYGRRRTLPELASSNFNVRSLGERMAMNTPIQGTAADIIKLAMVRVYRRLKAEGLRARLILQVHDELIVECPAEEKERAAKVLGEEMRGAAELRVPLSADVNSGTTWYAAKG